MANPHRFPTAALLVLGLLVGLNTIAADACRLISAKGDVRWQPAGQTNWYRFASTNVALAGGTRIDVRDHGEAMILLPNGCVHRAASGSSFVVQPPEPSGTVRSVLEKGLHYFFDRGKSESLEIKAGGGSGLFQGTELTVRILADGGAEFSLLEGAVVLTNASGTVRLEGIDAARVAPGDGPRRVPAIQAKNTIQWFLYYPAVLESREPSLADGERARLATALEAYRFGDVAGALAAWPADWTPGSPGSAGSPAARALHAQLLLGVGDIDAARSELAGTTGPEAENVLTLLGAVTDPANTVAPADDATASRALALAYLAQANRRLVDARALARASLDRSPGHGFAWAYLAELEFGFGELEAARTANRRARELAPRHAPAAALDGFLAAAGNHPREAMAHFDEAIRLDPRLANGWLGRGLCRIRVGDRAGGLEDLTIAAATEPNRSLLRSHLAKAWEESGDPLRARHELALARELDPRDPTPHFYGALMAYDQNRINDAIGGLEESLAANDNRAVFRSGLRLDEDRAVRGTGLARVYARAGLSDVALREASRAVAADYGNYAAHLFLAETYDALRDPTRFNLRYETAWFNELLLADLLAPVGAGTFSPNVSQQEYTRLFEHEAFGLSSVTEWRSDRQWHELATQSGYFGRTAWSLDVDYEHHAGVRPNNDLDRIEWYSRIKQQVSNADTVTLLAKVQEYSSGDNFQYQNPADASRSFRYDESQHPILVGGWRHEWSPGVQTLALAGRLENDQRFRQDDVAFPELLLHAGDFPPNSSIPSGITYRGQLEIYTAELSQIVETEHQVLVAGGRIQSGDTRVQYRIDPKDTGFLDDYPSQLGVDRNGGGDIRRWSAYLYETWKPIDALALTAGISYERLEAPADFRSPPLGGGQVVHQRVEPKASVVWTATTNVVVRGMYAQSLGGVSLDESFRLEPVQLAGFSQAFRTVIPETFAGSVTAPRFEVAGLALDTKWPGRWYAGLGLDWIRSQVTEGNGLFEFDFTSGDGTAVVRPHAYRYDERAATLALDKLVGEQWSFGASVRGARTRLSDQFDDYGSVARRVSTLGEFGLRAGWNHPDGWFGTGMLRWELQDWRVSRDNTTDPGNASLASEQAGGADVPFVDLRAGWRFPRNRAELSVGVLNALDRDYHIDALGGLPEFARGRVFTARFRFNF